MLHLYSRMIRPLLFCVDAELAHAGTVELCRIAGQLPWITKQLTRRTFYEAPVLRTEVAGIAFRNPLGLAAGWDKSGRAVKFLDRLGFGFAEIGSVSGYPSLGNPKPRLFRLPQDRAIIVNYGLPNDGAEIVRERLCRANPAIPVGINIVQTNRGPGAAECSDEEILSDYGKSFRLLNGLSSYVVLNLSCPNAVGGKEFFSQPGNITRLLERLETHRPEQPIFLKVPPVLDDAMHDRWLEETDRFLFVKGFLFNLPSGKHERLSIGSPRCRWEKLPGAVSGPPVAELMIECLRAFAKRINRKRYTLIGSGGIASGRDAYRMIRLGASLVQLYTAFIYEGPAITRRINYELANLLVGDGFTSVQDAVGVDV